jgi:hypothetical protein
LVGEELRERKKEKVGRERKRERYTKANKSDSDDSGWLYRTRAKSTESGGGDKKNCPRNSLCKHRQPLTASGKLCRGGYTGTRMGEEDIQVQEWERRYIYVPG